MGMELADLLPHLLLMLGGGLTTSFGLAYVLRRGRGLALMTRLRWWGLTLFGLVAVGSAVGGFWWMLRQAMPSGGEEATLGPPLQFLLFGLMIGLPMSLPGVIAAWSESRPAKIAARQERRKKASRQDRQKFADDLVRQIQEFAQSPREVKATLSGDKGRVLLFKGDLERHEGDKLVGALRNDLQDLGFERIECEGPKGKWWSRV